MDIPVFVSTLFRFRECIRLLLLFIPVAFLSYLWHEFGHWSVGRILGNEMAYSLNGVWPENGEYINPNHGLYVGIGGPAFSILQALIALVIIEKFKSLYAFPFLIFPAVSRLFSLVFGGFGKQDEAGISSTLGLGTYTVAILVISLLILFVWRGSFKLKLGFREVNLFIFISLLSKLLVIWTNSLIT